MKKNIEINQQIELAAEEWVRLCIQVVNHKNKKAQPKKDGEKYGKSK